MPDFDSGHIFLTTLAPIRDSGRDPGQHTSFTQAARIALAKLPTAQQSPATVGGPNSPFARNRRTHLARMFVLNDVIYNGRQGKNALLAAVTGDDPAVPQPVDRLKTSYVVFCADIDAVTEDGAPLPKTLSEDAQRKVREAYARELWATMEAELRSVYENCLGFEGVETGDDFAAYLNRCHVETTMPFHDYYIAPPAFHRINLPLLIGAVAVPLVLALLALVLRIFGVMEMPVLGISTLWTFVLGALVTGAAGYGVVLYANLNGAKPLPPGKYDDLPSVLKALYLQQKFSDFVVEGQGASPDELHKQFGAFLEAHRPGDRTGPTQEPGVIAAPKA